jgi:hypothetical protein
VVVDCKDREVSLRRVLDGTRQLSHACLAEILFSCAAKHLTKQSRVLWINNKYNSVLICRPVLVTIYTVLYRIESLNTPEGGRLGKI